MTPPITAMAMASSSYITPMPAWAVSPRAATTMPASAASIAGDDVDQHQVVLDVDARCARAASWFEPMA